GARTSSILIDQGTGQFEKHTETTTVRSRNNRIGTSPRDVLKSSIINHFSHQSPSGILGSLKTRSSVQKICKRGHNRLESCSLQACIKWDLTDVIVCTSQPRGTRFVL